MGVFERQEVVAPTQQAAIVAAIKVECTRDTRGESPCPVKDCENCN